MTERFKNCAFYKVMEKGTPEHQKVVFDNLCKPSCKEICPVTTPNRIRRQENLNIAHGVRVRGTVYFNGEPRIEKNE